jgi:hypothetical protein
MIARIATVVVGFWFLLTYSGQNDYAEHCRGRTLT